MDGKYVGSRPIKLRKSNWKDRNLEQASGFLKKSIKMYKTEKGKVLYCFENVSYHLPYIYIYMYVYYLEKSPPPLSKLFV